MIRVAAYCRVSTDKDDQANSFESQQRYFRDYISRNPTWELYDIYADEGLSGTGTKKRKEFNRMIADAHAGKVQYILTKEVSRFSRNIVDTLSYTRDLKRIGVPVEFVTDHINTMDGDGELRLSIMASIAQEESRKTSARVIWGQTRQMERGVVFGLSLLGYDVEKGKLVIEPKGAALVQLIFRKYALEQMGTGELSRYLNREGYRTYRGGTWKPSAVIKILKNEKYVGDLIQKKTYTPDYLTHDKRTNKGAVPLVELSNHHEPIITRELWDAAQERLSRNNKHGDGDGGHSNRYIFSGKIKCGLCGASFVGRTKQRKDGTKLRRWSCGTVAATGAQGCSIGTIIRDDDAILMLQTAIGSLQINRESILANLTNLALDATQTGTTDAPERLAYELERVGQKKEAVLDSYFSGDISKEDMHAMKRRYEEQEHSLRERIERAKERGQEIHLLQESIRSTLTSLLCCETPSEVLYKCLLDCMTVFPDQHTQLHLKGLPLVFHFSYASLNWE